MKIDTMYTKWFNKLTDSSLTLLPPLPPVRHYCDLDLPAGTSGVYFLWDECEIVYVGQSVDIRERIHSHGDKHHDAVSLIPIGDPYLRCLAESFYITKLTPKYNKEPPKKSSRVSLQIQQKEGEPNASQTF